MVKVRIYQPAKTATQSGQAKKDWILEFVSSEEIQILNPLTGWVSTTNTESQRSLRFKNKEQAIAYATEHQFSYTVDLSHSPKFVPKRYSDKFKFNPL